MIDLKDIYRYVPFIYTCDRCSQQYPIWMVSKKDWKKGVKKMGPNFGPSKHICKPCFEEFNPSPKYLTVDEYIEEQAAAWGEIMMMSQEACPSMERKRETVAALWDLPSQYTDAEHDEVVAKIGWKRGPYQKDR
jgi:hypothetical protein